MPQNLYYVQPGDTLTEIAKLPKAGGGPYYVVLPGDTLYCIAKEFNTTVPVLATINQMFNPNILISGVELLIGSEIPNPKSLKTCWINTAKQGDNLNPLQIHSIYYIGSFQWTALGRTAVPYLLELLKDPCETVRLYAVISLGRLAVNRTVRNALRDALQDTTAVAEMAKLSLRRIDLAARGQKRIHLVTANTFLAAEPFLNSTAISLPKGTEVIVTRWNVPSPTGEEMPPGGLAVWDQVQVVETGKIGFLLRVGYGDIELI